MHELAKLLARDGFPPSGATGRNLGWYDVATLSLVSGELWIGDPGFSAAELHGDDGLRVALEPGTYSVRACVVDFGTGNFVARLRVCSLDLSDLAPGEEIGEAGTDSAAIGVCDARELLAAFRSRFGDDMNMNAAAQFLEDFDYQRCGVLQPDENVEASLVYVHSGFGDGGGPVYELVADGRRVGVEVPFIPDES